MTVTSHWPDVAMRIRKNVHLAVADVGRAVETQIVGNITTAGLVDTSNYRRSWTTEAEGNEAIIGSPVEYGVYLEYGYQQKAGQLYPKTRGNTTIGWGRTSGRFIAGRPHVVPAAKKIAMRVTEFFRGLDR